MTTDKGALQWEEGEWYWNEYEKIIMRLLLLMNIILMSPLLPNNTKILYHTLKNTNWIQKAATVEAEEHKS